VSRIDVSGERKKPGQLPRHYDLEVWKDAMRLVREAYRVTASFPDAEKFGLTSQIRRSAISIPSNIAEGAARGGRVELIRFLTIARDSLAELDTQIWIARDLGFFNDAQDYQDNIQLLMARLNALITSNRKKTEGSR
jgi:four helix bundle protein